MTSDEQPSRWAQLGSVAQYFLPQHTLTAATGWLMRQRAPWLKNALIRLLIRLYDIDTSEAARPVPDGYGSVNEFFTRRLEDGARPIDSNPRYAVSPADGRVSAAGRIDGGTLIQAKGHQYELSALLQDEALAERFAGGSFATIYLAPSDYHRVHWPCGGTLRGHWPIDGRLFAVNGATASVIPQLFARNARQVFHIDGQHSDVAMVMVGALNVASITIPWREQGLTRCERGDIAAWFNMGSTVILLLPAGWALAEEITAGATVRVGQRLALWQEAADA